ncbi:hypothetical protein PV689_16700 [Streptomyces sp. ATCC51928]|uniref:Integral membrane protein n=1 Tax=Streptomyces caviscabies TaxID=90079 RepID=A0ABW2MKP4_9ACTN|nr:MULTISPECIES: hypothetical protein [unclassified Streptomyces]MDX3503554.1 hypothetical protein [Streptomyces sp. ATCC51928]MDX5525367.1 hypothetical protein [Streptomyces sp. DE06-01C]
MVVVATVLRWILLTAALGILTAFLVTAVRARRAGTGFGELADVLEDRWFAMNRVFLAVLAGLAGSWAAEWAGGTRAPITESVPVLAPLGIVAAFVVGRAAGPFRVKPLVLIAAPLLLGGVMTGW